MRLLIATICCWVPRSEILRVEYPYLFLANLRAVFAGHFFIRVRYTALRLGYVLIAQILCHTR
jgi:hypothetical protein